MMIPVSLEKLIDLLAFTDVEAADTNRTSMRSIAWN
jgi:hypothetical protein